ncbi:hypothetical protein BTVI_154021 [Pitangus sulphuratus]|nr:hypothetical protein BTVI_154021 [Pitangus sulphuratus]
MGPVEFFIPGVENMTMPLQQLCKGYKVKRKARPVLVTTAVINTEGAAVSEVCGGASGSTAALLVFTELGKSQHVSCNLFLLKNFYWFDEKPALLSPFGPALSHISVEIQPLGPPGNLVRRKARFQSCRFRITESFELEKTSKIIQSHY